MQEAHNKIKDRFITMSLPVFYDKKNDKPLKAVARVIGSDPCQPSSLQNVPSDRLCVDAEIKYIAIRKHGKPVTAIPQKRSMSEMDLKYVPLPQVTHIYRLCTLVD